MDGREARAAANASCGRSDDVMRTTTARPARSDKASAAWRERHRVGTGERGHRAGDARDLVQPTGAQASGAQLGGEKVGGVGSQLELPLPAR